MFREFPSLSFLAGLHSNPLLALLITLLAASVWFDIKSRRIPNWLIVAGLMSSFAIQVISSLGSLSSWGLGLLVGFGLFIPFYLLRAMGAGDVKLMAVVGSFMGPSAALNAVLLTLIAGGLLATGVSLWHGAFRSVLFNLRVLLTHTLGTVLPSGMTRLSYVPSSVGNLPYALAIAAGTVMHLILAMNGRSLFT